ncbi:MAG: acyl-CoA thioesterase II [Desulfobacteraceae bacterium]|nr:acyl-CoA thioesterase II [Desulfobacteraceae bacterium]
MNPCDKGNVLDQLLTLLTLETIEKNIFRGRSQDLGFGTVFGGQVLGQALAAATSTVDSLCRPHSLHGYFMRPGDPARPIVYTVDCIRNGRSFFTRRVVAVQNGKAVFSMSCSFQRDEPGFDHQETMPDIPGPEEIAPETEGAKRLSGKIAPCFLEKLLSPKPIDIRVVNPVDPLTPKILPPEKYVWFRAIAPMPDDMAIHRHMLAYASDFHLVSTSLYPHGKTYWLPEMQVASLDHAIWFHRGFRMDDWLLYAMKSPSASRGRGLTMGNIFTRTGSLVATVAQEGLIRRLTARNGGNSFSRN